VISHVVSTDESRHGVQQSVYLQIVAGRQDLQPNTPDPAAPPHRSRSSGLNIVMYY